MAKHILLVLTNPVEGQEAAYNDWYDNVHLHEVLALEGFAGATRYRLGDTQAGAGGDPPWCYLSIYELDTDDAAAAMARLSEAASGHMVMSPPST